MVGKLGQRFGVSFTDGLCVLCFQWNEYRKAGSCVRPEFQVRFSYISQE